MDFSIRIATYHNKLNTLFKLHDMVSKHIEQNDTPINRLALEMSRHHIERRLIRVDNRS